MSLTQLKNSFQRPLLTTSRNYIKHSNNPDIYKPCNVIGLTVAQHFTLAISVENSALISKNLNNK